MNKKKSNIFIGLIHHPVYDKNCRIVTTAVTNLDLHDLARTAMVFDVKRYYVVMPLETQKVLIEQIISHWVEGHGSTYNPDRKQAFDRVKVVHDLNEAVDDLKESFGGDIVTVATSAREVNANLSVSEFRKRMVEAPGDYFILFGTGWGLTDEVIGECDYTLAPIRGVAGYNHLPVRAAAAIILDRLTRPQEI